ncbi:carbohydrate ABC transporter permease [Mesomycoplasma molare]|uniref:Sugar ABC transporter permease n=1 Tax=Mesomycoplasma molare TaxID=171288 RepID=A0ABY5TYQ6_9BACT|nr:sugar ABC transporter permease [Mesomycoplasma molare]UWD34179.1 sugar ABC transporter permease [Mesomycoplasma molare]
MFNKINTYFLSKKIKVKKHELGILEKKVSFWKPFLLLFPSLIIIILFTIIPFIYASIQSVTYLPDPNDATTVEYGIGSFKDVLSETAFQIGIRNSLIYAIASLPITLIIAILISSAIASLYRKWAKGFWQTVFFLPYVTSAIAISIAFAYIFDTEFGIINKIFNINTKWLDSGQSDSYLAIFVMLIYGVWKNLAFQILIITTAMLAVDKTLYKAASIDGASKVKQFFRITLPSITKTLNFLITIGIIGGIKVFPIAIFNNDLNAANTNGGSTIILYIYGAVKQGNYSLAGAATIILFILGIALSTFLKQTIKISLMIMNKLGEKHVLNTIKATKLPIK